MSWLNNSLNTIKGQLTTLAQEVLAETAGPGDAEYRGEVDETQNAIELLATTQKEKEELQRTCSEYESKIEILKKQIAVLQSEDTRQTSKSSSDDNVVLEDSWCWEPDNAKADNDRTSESSSGNGAEMVNITLEEVPLGASAKTAKLKQSANVLQLQQRIRELKEQNEQLSSSLEELDGQHNVAMQNVLELKSSLQEKLLAVTKDYEALKKQHEDKFIKSELEMARLRKQVETIEKERKQATMAQQQMQEEIERYQKELRTSIEELADMQKLLRKRDDDNLELIERVKAADLLVNAAHEDRNQLLERLNQLSCELEQSKDKKTSEHSEDEFIVVRDPDGEGEHERGSTLTSSNEELREKMIALENRVSELLLENGSLTRKLQDREMEKDLTASVLKENLQAMERKYDEQEAQLRAAIEERTEQLERLAELKERAAESLIANEQVKVLNEEKQKVEGELSELQKRLLLSEQEKEQLQLELQSVRLQQERINELEHKIQDLTLENQQFKLNKEAETEERTNSAELEEKLQRLRQENEGMRLDLEEIAQAKFSLAIAQEKQKITDLDADEDDEAFTIEQLKQMLQSDEVEQERALRMLRDRLNKVDELEANAAQLSEQVIDLKNSKLMWDHEKHTLEADISQYILQCDELMKNNEILLNELENFKRNKLETISEHNEDNVLHLEAQLEEYSSLNHTLETVHAELGEKLEVLDREKQELTEKLRATQRLNEQLKHKQQELELEKSNLIFELNELRSTESATVEVKDEVLRLAEEKCADLEKQLSRLSSDHADLVSTLQDQKNALSEATRRREQLEQQLKSQEQEEELETQLQQELLAKDTMVESLKHELTEMRQTKQLLEQQLLEMQNTMVNVEEMLNQEKGSGESLRTEMETLINEQENLVESKKLEEAQQLNEQLQRELNEMRARFEAENSSAMAELQKRIEVLQFEKNEIIKALQQKHAENTQYYAELQRLQGMVQQLQSEKAALEELRSEKEKLVDQNNFLKEKSDILTTNLLTEQTNQKLLTQEKAELESKNSSLLKDLERLRAHLMEIEELHTKESMQMQHELKETKAKMLKLQEEVANSSNAYTSASIRANQHAETLQAQYALLVQQRDELVAKLNAAEDRESKNQAALCNLQCALEQFQNGRENDIKAATQRLRKELQQQAEKEAQLQQDINLLNRQLAEANEGLKAAARLSDQLEAAQQNIAVLREEVDGLKDEKEHLERNLALSESSQSDKIEKSLVKSLLIGYVVSSNNNDKQQILRVISSVLDFTANESDRCGLNKPQSHWFSAIIGGQQQQQDTQNSNDNLMTAFVQFLEKESQPNTNAAPLPNLLNIVGNTGSVKDSGQVEASSSGGGGVAPVAMPTASAPLPLVLNSDVLNEFAPSRNSSSILKDILNDS